MVWVCFAMNVLNGGRIGIASQAIIATGAYEIALKYSKEEKHLEKRFSIIKLLPKLADIMRKSSC
jgi:alkylation response protein AidB-like acyl-CoA dehydrogenase